VIITHAREGITYASQIDPRAAAKTHFVHLAHDLEPGFLVQCQTCLVEQAIGSGASRLT